MTPPDFTTAWSEHRAAVFGTAYRILGSVSDAEDIEQNTWLRAASSDLTSVRDLRAWLVTIAARLSYDLLRSPARRREDYLGPWLPEPLITGPGADVTVLVDDTVSTAVLLVMETLPPAQRVAFVLREALGLGFDEIARVLEVTAPNARQLASRARKAVRAQWDEPTPDTRADRERLLENFRRAYESGDLATLIEMLTEDVVYVTDGGGEAFAARKLITGGKRVAEVMVRVGKRWRPDQIDLVEVGGELSMIFRRDGAVYSVDTIRVERGLIAEYRRVMNPKKIRHI